MTSRISRQRRLRLDRDSYRRLCRQMLQRDGWRVSASEDRAKSAAVYKDLLGLWKDADLDIPILRQAKAGYAKLQKSIADFLGKSELTLCHPESIKRG